MKRKLWVEILRKRKYYSMILSMILLMMTSFVFSIFRRKEKVPLQRYELHFDTASANFRMWFHILRPGGDLRYSLIIFPAFGVQITKKSLHIWIIHIFTNCSNFRHAKAIPWNTLDVQIKFTLNIPWSILCTKAENMFYEVSLEFIWPAFSYIVVLNQIALFYWFSLQSSLQGMTVLYMILCTKAKNAYMCCKCIELEPLLIVWRNLL